MFSQNSDANKPLQMLNHIWEKNSINFLISNIHSLIVIEYQLPSGSKASFSPRSSLLAAKKKNKATPKEPKIVFYSRNSGDIFLKLHNTNGVMIQGINLHKKDSEGNPGSVMQYFFVDQRN